MRCICVHFLNSPFSYARTASIGSILEEIAPKIKNVDLYFWLSFFLGPVSMKDT